MADKQPPLAIHSRGDPGDVAKTELPTGDKAKVYKDYRDLLADESLDAVLITTPVFLHAEHFEAAVENTKKHIWCEKPAAPDVARVRRIDEAGRKVGDGRVVPAFICQALSGKPLTAFGDGSQTLSMNAPCPISSIII